MKTILVQLGNPHDTHGAILAECLILGKDNEDTLCIAVSLEGQHYVGELYYNNRGPDFPSAEQYCTRAMPYGNHPEFLTMREEGIKAFKVLEVKRG
jgi:hypothetical protein